MAAQYVVSVKLSAVDKISTLFQKIGRGVDKLKNKFKGLGTRIKNFASKATPVVGALKGLSIGFLATAAAVTALSTKLGMNFEQAMADIQALTGLAGKDLDVLKGKAFKMSEQFGISASKIVSNMAVIGSKRPDLLANADALAEVTKQITILATSSDKITMEESVDAVTAALNQYNFASKETSRIVNTMASASQKGSADVQFLGKAITIAGGFAKSAGVPFEQLVTAIELVGPQLKSAETTGTGLKNVFFRLNKIDIAKRFKMTAREAEKYDMRTVGLTKALENLAKLNRQEILKFVGMEGAPALQSLLEGIEGADKLRFGKSFDEFTKSITGTNKALEQAETRMSTAGEAAKRLQQTISNSLIKPFLESKGPIKDVIEGITKKIQWLGKGTRESNLVRVWVLMIVGVLGVLATAVMGATVVLGLMAAGVTGAMATVAAGVVGTIGAVAFIIMSFSLLLYKLWTDWDNMWEGMKITFQKFALFLIDNNPFSQIISSLLYLTDLLGLTKNKLNAFKDFKANIVGVDRETGFGKFEETESLQDVENQYQKRFKGRRTETIEQLRAEFNKKNDIKMDVNINKEGNVTSVETTSPDSNVTTNIQDTGGMTP